MIKEEMESKLKSQSIKQIEAGIRGNHNKSLGAQREMIIALSYLKYSKRYKENPQYKTNNFSSYLIGMFNMRLNTFEEMGLAYRHFPEETMKYGVGVVAKVRRKCGPIKQKVALDEINAIQKNNKPISRDKIERVIQKYTPVPKEKATRIVVDWEMKYHEEVKAHRETKIFLANANEQIEKLKKSVLELQPLRKIKTMLQPLFAEARA